MTARGSLSWVWHLAVGGEDVGDKGHRVNEEVQALDFNRSVCVIIRGSLPDDYYQHLASQRLPVTMHWMFDAKVISLIANRFHRDMSSSVFFVNVSPRDEALIPLLCKALQTNCSDFEDRMHALQSGYRDVESRMRVLRNQCEDLNVQVDSSSRSNYIILDAQADSFAATLKQIAECIVASAKRREDRERQSAANKREQ